MNIGVKIYSYDWYTNHQLSPKQLVNLLQKWRITDVMVMNDILDDMSKSDHKLAQRSLDQSFREACREAAIEYWMTIRSFYNPKALAQHAEWQIMNQEGEWISKKDWYIGINPSNDNYINWLIQRINIAQSKLDPDGAFLSFTRWPGFWETWIANSKEDYLEDSSYDPFTINKFEQNTGIIISSKDKNKPYQWLKKNAWQQWVFWKCNVINEYCIKVRKQMKVLNPNIKLMLNTLPFNENESNNIRKEVFGQDIKMLSNSIDIFEIMTYHQIMKQGFEWILKTGLKIKNQTDKPIICTLQSTPYYLDGIHQNAEREKFVDLKELEKVYGELKQNNFYGIAFFPLKDLLSIYYKEENIPFWV